LLSQGAIDLPVCRVVSELVADFVLELHFESIANPSMVYFFVIPEISCFGVMFR
jgi:hypothetical protein